MLVVPWFGCANGDYGARAGDISAGSLAVAPMVNRVKSAVPRFFLIKNFLDLCYRLINRDVSDVKNAFILFHRG